VLPAGRRDFVRFVVLDSGPGVEIPSLRASIIRKSTTGSRPRSRTERAHVGRPEWADLSHFESQGSSLRSPQGFVSPASWPSLTAVQNGARESKFEHRCQSISAEIRGAKSFQWGTCRGTCGARNFDSKVVKPQKPALNCPFPVVGTGVDPVTSRFSGRSSSAAQHDARKVASVLPHVHRDPPVDDCRSVPG
jgi:hypothetical protein